MTVDEYVALFTPFATAIDFDDLIARGILKKTGRALRPYRSTYLRVRPIAS